MTEQKSPSVHQIKRTEDTGQSDLDKPLVMADGHIATDGGQMLLVHYVDIGATKKTTRPKTLVKAIEAQYSLAHNDTIRISTPHRFRDEGESMIQDNQEGHAEKRQEQVHSNDYAKKREEQQQALHLLDVTDVTLGLRTGTNFNNNANHMSYGGGSWIFCTAIQPNSKKEWQELRQSLSESYNDYTTIHQPNKFAQALGLMFIDQVGPQAADGTVRHGSEETDALVTLHDSLLIYHGPVFYTDEVYDFLSAHENTHLAKLYPLFVKDRAYEGQQEYRFVIVGNSDITSQYTDLRVSGMMKDSLIPIQISSTVRVKRNDCTQSGETPLTLRPKNLKKTKRHGRKQVETHTITITRNGQEVAREVHRREVEITVTSESVVDSESLPDLLIGEQRNVAHYTEEQTHEYEVDGVTVETEREEQTIVGQLKEVEDTSLFTLEDQDEARHIFEAVNDMNVDISPENPELQRCVRQLFKFSYSSELSKNHEIASSSWHSLWALFNLFGHYGDIIEKIEVEQDRFISISLKPSSKSQASGQILVGPLGTYAYVLRNNGEREWGAGGEDTRLVLFPDKDTIAEFADFGWEVDGMEH